MSKKGNLSAAKKAKNDEFYTQITDIETENISCPGRKARVRSTAIFGCCASSATGTENDDY